MKRFALLNLLLCLVASTAFAQDAPPTGYVLVATQLDARLSVHFTPIGTFDDALACFWAGIALEQAVHSIDSAAPGRPVVLSCIQKSQPPACGVSPEVCATFNVPAQMILPATRGTVGPVPKPR